MKLVKKFGVIASALVLAAGIQVSAYAADVTTTATTSNIKIAVVNVQQVLQQSPRVAELSKKLEGQFKSRQTKINDEQKTLQAELDKFNKESPTMNATDRSNQEKKLSAERAELVKQVVQYQQDLQKEQNKIMQGILGDLNGIVSGIAKQQGFTVVFDAQAVVFAADGSDITKPVADAFNKK